MAELILEVTVFTAFGLGFYIVQKAELFFKELQFASLGEKKEYK